MLIRWIYPNIVTEYRIAPKCIPRQHFTSMTLLFVQSKFTKTYFNIPNNYWVFLPVPKFKIEMNDKLLPAADPTEPM